MMVNINQKIVKLDKQECNRILEYISNINKEQGLFLKLIYVYGRSTIEVSKLKVSDIDVKHGLIDFVFGGNIHSFRLVDAVRENVLEAIKGKDTDEYIFKFDGNKVSRNLNRFIDNMVKGINRSQVLDRHCPKLSVFDFKQLRGQHLFIDGVELDVINELYCYEKLESLRNLINYNELRNSVFACKNVTVLLRDSRFTDLGVFHDKHYDSVDVDLFTVSCGDECVVFEYNYVDGATVILEGDDGAIVSFVDGLSKTDFDGVFRYLSGGDYKIIDGFKVMKN